MRIHVAAGAAILVMLAAAGAPAATAQAHGTATLVDVQAYALRHNPDILAARLRGDSAHGEQRIARQIPNPFLQSAPNQPWQYTVTMPLDVMPQRVYRTRAAARGTDAARADVDDVIRLVTFQVRQGFYDVLLSQRQREIAAERRDIFRQLLAADSARLKSGDVPAREVTKTELELARAEAGVTRADADVHAARLALQLLMGIDVPDTSFAADGEFTYQPITVPQDSLMALAIAMRPDLGAANQRVAQSQALDHLASSLWVPVPELTFSHQHGGTFASGDLFTNGSSNSLGFGFTFPIFYWNGGEREKSRAGLSQAQVTTHRVQAQVANDVATALDDYLAARALAQRYEGGLLTRAQNVLETARYAYRTGAISLLELLDAIQTWSETRGDYFTAIHDYWVAVFELSRATGQDFGP